MKLITGTSDNVGDSEPVDARNYTREIETEAI
jgi:hypothetical protein